jgi:hypothetical protein
MLTTPRACFLKTLALLHQQEMQDKRAQSDFLLVETLLKCSSVIKKISHGLIILLTKRATVEEKMIKSYLAQLASAQAQIAETITRSLASFPATIDDKAVQQAFLLADRVSPTLDSFLKAAGYNLNYLEQYFEHGFYDELMRSNFLEESQRISKDLTRALASQSADLSHASPNQAETE